MRHQGSAIGVMPEVAVGHGVSGGWRVTDSAGRRPMPMTTQGLRRVSADSVLRMLRTGEVMTATELMALTGLSRTAVHDVCNDLLVAGWIVESEGLSAATGPGRRPRRYALNLDFGRVLGIDIGASTVTAAVSDMAGNPVAQSAERLADPALHTRRRQVVVDRVVAAALSAAGVGESDVLAVGVGVPAAVQRDGRLARRRDIPGHPSGAHVAGAVAAGRSWPVLVENDANLAALAERWKGAAQGVDDFIVLLAGERLGAGIFVDGRPARGHFASAGELRFFELIPSIGSTYGIGHQARTLGMRAVSDRTATPTLVNLASSKAGRVDAETVFQAARAGDVSSLDIITAVCRRLAHIVAVLATLLDPEMVVIAGGVAGAADLLVPATRALLPAGMINNPPLITASTLGKDAVVRGGTRLALNHLDAHLLDDFEKQRSG